MWHFFRHQSGALIGGSILVISSRPPGDIETFGGHSAVSTLEQVLERRGLKRLRRHAEAEGGMPNMLGMTWVPHPSILLFHSFTWTSCRFGTSQLTKALALFFKQQVGLKVSWPQKWMELLRHFFFAHQSVVPTKTGVGFVACWNRWNPGPVEMARRLGKQARETVERTSGSTKLTSSMLELETFSLKDIGSLL